MLDALAQVCNEDGRLVGVSCAIFDGDARFVSAVALRFDHLTMLWRAVPDDDTLAASIGPLSAEPGEILVDAAGSSPWRRCLGLGLRWGWRMTNQQGYADGVRLEFGAAGGASGVVVELLVVASAIRVFEATEQRHD